MTSVSRDIRIVIQNILDTEELNKIVDREIIKTFTIEVQSILRNIQIFPGKGWEQDARKGENDKIKIKMEEVKEEEEHSGSFGLQFNGRGGAREEGEEEGEGWEMNQQMKEENQFLTAKLEEAEEYIKKMEEEQSILEEQLQELRELKQSKP